MRKMKLFFTALAVMMTSVAFAQNITVTGNVKDSSTGEFVPFASISVKGTMTGASTDADGQYSMTVPADGVLVFTSLGYHSAEIFVDGKTVIDVELNPDKEVLESAVAVGYGSARKVGTLVGSVTTVKSEAITNAPSASPLDQLQGQVAGLAVMTTGGIAGESNVSMSLHGVGSLGSSSTPLFIIDGIQSSSRAIMAMNPNDIESISILKDASATSIYGSRAANGVVFVTTKAGAYNSKATVTIRSQAGISTLADMTLYKNMMSGPELKEFWVKAGLMTPAQIKANFTDNGYDADTKWYNVLQQFNNPQYQNDVTVEGGGNKVAYMIGASQFHQRGTTIGNYYDRYTVRSNVQGHPKNWLKVGANLSLSYDKRQTNGNWGGASSVSNYTSGGLSYLNNPLYPVIDPETGEYYPTKFPSGMMNPHYYMENLPNLTSRYGLLASFNVSIEPFKNFTISSRAGVDGSIYYQTSTRMPSYVSNPLNGTRSRLNEIDYAATITNTIEYSFDIASDHNFVLLAGHEGVLNHNDWFQASSQGITDDRLINLNNGVQSTFKMEEGLSQSKFLSFFGRLDYNFGNKYFFDASVRNDSSSRFGPKNRNATFWAVGGMWKIKNEGFLANSSWINDLNLKVSYGTQGNASIGDYQHYALLSSSTDYAEGASMIVGQPSNPALTWEQQNLLTVALNTRLWNKVDLGLEYYHRTTSSMLMEVPYNYTTGFSNLYANVGGLLNQGVDVTLGVDILRGKDYFLRASTTFNYNAEKVTELFNNLDRWEMVGYGFAYVVGKPVSFYAPIFAGIDPEDGMPMWYLPGENVDETTMNETTKVYDEAGLTQNTGKRLNAPIYGGFNLSGGWRGISVQADFAYVLGKTLVNNDMLFYANPNQFAGMNQHKSVNDFWTPENTDATYPDWSKGAVMQFDTHMYENANFLRLKNLQVAYDVPRRLLGNQQVINGIKVSFTGRNLFTATKFSGIDPEVNSNLTYGRAGNSKQYLFGLEITF